MEKKIAKRILKNQNLIMQALVNVIVNQESEDVLDLDDREIVDQMWNAQTKTEQIIKKYIDCKCS